MEIKAPVGVDSIGKLLEWLDECGMPQVDIAKPKADRASHRMEPHNRFCGDCGATREAIDDNIAPLCGEGAAIAPAERQGHRIEHEQWMHGFAFDRDDRDAANKGYRDLVLFYAGAFYGRFSGCQDGTRIMWRVRPEMDECEQTVTTHLDGSPVDWDAYETLDEDERPEFKTAFTGKRLGTIRCRLAVILPPQVTCEG